MSQKRHAVRPFGVCRRGRHRRAPRVQGFGKEKRSSSRRKVSSNMDTKGSSTGGQAGALLESRPRCLPDRAGQVRFFQTGGGTARRWPGKQIQD